MEAPVNREYLPVADIEITAVRPDRHGYVLEGRGADAADYRLDLHLDIPVDSRTRSILGGMLAQSELRIWRRPSEPLGRLTARRQRRAPRQKPV